MIALQFVSALAHTESGDNPNAPLGDNGRASGRWQMHPDWFWEWANHYNLPPDLNETLDSWFGRIILAFANDHLRWMEPINAAMYFHLGHQTNPSKPDWDAAYAARFESFC